MVWSELSEEEVLEQVEKPISSHSSGLDLVLLRDENEVETKKVAELTQVLLISARHVTEPLMRGFVLAPVFRKGIYRVHFNPKEKF